MRIARRRSLWRHIRVRPSAIGGQRRALAVELGFFSTLSVHAHNAAALWAQGAHPPRSIDEFMLLHTILDGGANAAGDTGEQAVAPAAGGIDGIAKSELDLMKDHMGRLEKIVERETREAVHESAALGDDSGEGTYTVGTSMEANWGRSA